MSNRLANIFIIIIVIVAAGRSVVYEVLETQTAVKLKFGKLVAANIEPGWHIKLPFMEEVKKFDRRILTIDSSPERYFTVEQKAMMVDLFAKWRILDVSRYYTGTNGDEAKARELIEQRINEGLRNEFGARTLHEVVSGERDQLMTDMTKKVNETIGDEFGIKIVDVRVKRIDLPEEVSGNVFNRMRSEREQEARKHRFEGKELAEGIRADADRQRIVIEAEAFRESEQIRGDGDAKSTEIYAFAYQKDPEFYSFLRSLQAYKQSFSSKSDILLIEPDSDFFKYLKSPSPQ